MQIGNHYCFNHVVGGVPFLMTGIYVEQLSNGKYLIQVEDGSVFELDHSEILQ